MINQLRDIINNTLLCKQLNESKPGRKFEESGFAESVEDIIYSTENAVDYFIHTPKHRTPITDGIFMIKGLAATAIIGLTIYSTIPNYNPNQHPSQESKKSKISYLLEICSSAASELFNPKSSDMTWNDLSREEKVKILTPIKGHLTENIHDKAVSSAMWNYMKKIDEQGLQNCTRQEQKRYEYVEQHFGLLNKGSNNASLRESFSSMSFFEREAKKYK